MRIKSKRTRRYKDLEIVLVAAIAATTAFTLGYRHWAYNGWMEYYLVCSNSNAERYDISRPMTPALLDAIEEYENIYASQFAEGDRPYYRDGDRIYMRPWYYIGFLGVSFKSTQAITNKALGGEFRDSYPGALGNTFCSNLFDNPRLFDFDSNEEWSVDYIYYQDYLWILRKIAPKPK